MVSMIIVCDVIISYQSLLFRICRYYSTTKSGLKYGIQYVLKYEMYEYIMDKKLEK